MSCVTLRRTLSLISIISLIAIACESLLLRYTSCGSHCFPALLTTVAGNYRVIYFSQMDNRHLLARHFPCACGGCKERHLCPCGDLLTRWIRSDSRLLSAHNYELPDKRVLHEVNYLTSTRSLSDSFSCGFLLNTSPPRFGEARVEPSISCLQCNLLGEGGKICSRRKIAAAWPSVSWNMAS